MATYYFRNVGSAWGTATNWSLTDGGVGDGAVPTISDDVFFTVNSGDCVLGTARDCKNLTFNGYVNIFTVSGNMRFYGDLLFATTAFTLAGTATWEMKQGGTTIQTNGKALQNLKIFHTSVLDNSLLSDTTVTGTYTSSIGGNTTALNGFTLFIGGSLISAQINRSMKGTTNLVMTGTGSITAFSNAPISMNLTIDTTGIITFSGTVIFQNATLTYIPNTGSVVTTGSVLRSESSTIWDVDGIVWDGVTIIGGTHTLTSNLDISGTWTSSNVLIYDGANINLFGSLLVNQAISGTANILYKGTGTWTGGGTIGNYFLINTIGGTLTCIGTISASNIEYSVGTVNTSGSTLTGRVGTNVWNLAGTTWNNLSIPAGTLVLNSLLTATGTATIAASNNVQFSGPSGFNIGTFVCSVAGRIITFTSGNIYTITNSMLTIGTLASRISFVATVPNSIKAKLNLAPGASQDNGYLSATDIDSSGGRSVWTYKGVLTREINWNPLSTNPKKHLLNFKTKVLK